MSELSKFESTVKKKRLPQILFIHGNEDYFLSKAIDLLIKNVIPAPERAFNLDIIDGSDSDSETILSSMLSFPFVGERRLTVVRRFDKLERKHRLDIAGHLHNLPETTILAMAAGEIKLTDEPYKTIVGEGERFSFNKLKGAELTGFLVESADALGKKLGKNAADLLVELSGDSAGDLASEVEKLSIYVGEREEINSDDVISGVGRSRSFNIFELQRAIGQRNVSKAQEIATKMLESGEKAIFINYMLTRYFLHLLQTKHLLEKRVNTNDISTKVFGRWNPFVNEYVNAAKGVSIATIKRALQVLLDTDAKLKNGGYQEDNAVTILVTEVAGSDQRS